MAKPDLSHLPSWHRHLCEQISITRKDRGLSGRALGKRAGISQNEISLYERGVREPSLTRLYKLATALDVDIHCLIQAGTEEKETSLLEQCHKSD